MLTVAELVRRGGDEIGQLCALKLGPRMKFVKLVQKLASNPAAPVVVPPAAASLSAELQAVRGSVTSS